MNLLITIVIAGMAASFVVELLGFLIVQFTVWNERVIKQLLSAPLAALACWLLGVSGWTLLVASLASGFFCIVVMWYMTRPVIVQNLSSRR